MVKTLANLSTQQSTKVHSEWCGCIRRSYEAKKKTHQPHKYPEIQLQVKQVFKDRTPISINVSTTSKMLSNIDIAHRQILLLITSLIEEQTKQQVSYEIRDQRKLVQPETRDLEIRGQVCVPHRQATHAPCKRIQVMQQVVKQTTGI